MAEEIQSQPEPTKTNALELKPATPETVASTHLNGHERKQPSKRKLWMLSAALLVIISAGAGFTGGWLGSRNAGSDTSIQKQQVVLKSQGQLISNIAKQVGPSVVSVEVTGQSQMSIFGYATPAQKGAGTGIIIDKNGLIITNRHVVPANVTKVSITLSDGTTFDDVEVLGRTSASDPLDVAFLKIKDLKDKALTPATLGDSSKANVGDSVVAIGNALGQFQNTVTSGILSGHGRSIEAGDASGGSIETLQNLFQTDAAINQGNSGGPLVNLDGEVIAINTAVAGDAQSIGFAIPINDVKGLVQTVMSKGKLERPYLGVVYVPITADTAKRYNLGLSEGAYILPADATGQPSIIKGGPAEKAGLKEGDIITKINSDTIDESHSLTSILGKHQVGDKVDVTYVRDSKEAKVSVGLEALPQN